VTEAAPGLAGAGPAGAGERSPGAGGPRGPQARARERL